MPEEAAIVEKAVRAVLKDGVRTEDIRPAGAVVVGTAEMGNHVVQKVGEFMA
jgi:hypothetical protein